MLNCCLGVRCTLFRRRSFQMNDELQFPMMRELARRADDEFLRIGIEITVDERRRIHGVEQLGKIAQPQLNR